LFKSVDGCVIILVVAGAGILLQTKVYGQIPQLHDVQLLDNQSLSTQSQKLVILNFDDTSVDQIRYVKPILDKYGFKATFFPVCGWVKSQAGWEAIERLHSDGMDIQSHSMTHPNLNTLSIEQLENEIGQSKQCLLRHGINASIFAYPYGAGTKNETVVNTIAKYYDLGRGATYPTKCVYSESGPECIPTEPSNTFVNRYDVNSWVPTHIGGLYDYSTYTCILDCEYYDNSQSFEQFIEVVNDQSNYDKDGPIKSIPIIVYHGFVSYENIRENKIPTDMSVSLFEKEMKYLHDNGFKVLTMGDLAFDAISNSLHIKEMPNG